MLVGGGGLCCPLGSPESSRNWSWLGRNGAKLCCLEEGGGNGAPAALPPQLRCVGRGARAGTHAHPCSGPLCSLSRVLHVPQSWPLFPKRTQADPSHWRQAWVLTEPRVCCLGATPQPQLRLGGEEACLGQKIWPITAVVKKGRMMERE